MKITFINFLIVILFTLNANAQWVKLDSIQSYDYQQVYFIDNDTGYILVGGLLLKTNDGAINWEILDNLNGGGYSMWFIDKEIGFIGAAEGLKKTIDGGLSWITNSQYRNVFSIHFINDSIGYAAGSGKGAKTTNQGETWIFLTAIPTYHIRSIFFLNELTGYIFGYHGESYKTLDGGETWVELNTNIESDIRSSYFTDEQTGYIVTYSLGSSSIMKTIDGGVSWNTVHQTPGYGLFSVFFNSVDTGYVAGGYKSRDSDPMILKTTDGGDTWVNQNPPDNPSKAIKSIHFVNKCVGYAVGIDGLILKTTNAGDSILCKEIPPADFKLNQNYPNPFNNKTTIDYNLPVDTQVQLKIYNILGQKVKTLVNTFQIAGEREITWNGTDDEGHLLSTGIYIYRIKLRNLLISKKMIYIK